MLTVLAFYLVPATYYTVTFTYGALFPKLEAREEARTSLEQKKANKIKADRTASKKLMNAKFGGTSWF